MYVCDPHMIHCTHVHDKYMLLMLTVICMLCVGVYYVGVCLCIVLVSMYTSSCVHHVYVRR